MRITAKGGAPLKFDNCLDGQVIGGDARKRTLVDIEADQGRHGMYPDTIEGKDRSQGAGAWSVGAVGQRGAYRDTLTEPSTQPQRPENVD